MKQAIQLIVGALLTTFALAGVSSSAMAQQKGGELAKQIVGTWTLVSAENTSKDGAKTLPFGPSPKGTAIFAANGRFAVINTNPSTPKFASNNRGTGTPEENKAVVTSTIALFGTYTVNEADKTLTWKVEGSTFPNWVGQEQKRPINQLTADELKYTNPAASIGAAMTLLAWKRIK